jgi:hypothetical protein
MIVKYKGFELSATREKSLGGDINIYYYIMRISDGWFLADSFTEADETIRDWIKEMKTEVDNYLANPQDYDEEE